MENSSGGTGTPNLTFRYLVFGILLLVGIIVGAVYWSGDSSQDSVVVLGEDFSNLHALESLKGDYEESYKTKVEFVGHSFEAFDQKANQDLASGTGLYGVILHYSSVLHNFAGKKWVLSVAELKEAVPEEDFGFEKDLFPEVWKDSSFYPVADGDTSPEPIGYPFAANTMVLVYNKSMFSNQDNLSAYREKYGAELEVPNNWNSFRNTAEFFTNPTQGTFGVILQGASGSPLYWEWCNFAFGMGGGVMDKQYGWQSGSETPLIINSAETVEATQFYVGLKPFNYGDFFSTGQAEQQEYMRTKEIAMAIMLSDSLFALINGPNGDSLGFAPIPGDKSMIGGGTFYVNRNSADPVEACRYVVRMMQEKTQIKLMKKGLCSGLRTAYEDPEVRKLPYVDAVRKSLDRGVYMLESGPDSGLIVETIESAIQRAWRGEISVEDGLEAAQAKIAKDRIELIK